MHNKVEHKDILSYNKETGILTVRNPIYHVSSISEKDGCQYDRYGYNVMYFDVRNQILYGSEGKTKLTIKPTKKELNRVLISCRKNSLTIRVGNLENSDSLDGKESLLDFLENHPDGKDSFGTSLPLQYLHNLLFRIAEERGLAKTFPDMTEEMKQLKAEEGFVSGKDYSDRYSVGDIEAVIA